jgi:hypothetical protein
MSDYDHEKWVEVYQSALLELEHSLMTGRLVDARAEIVARVEKLRELTGLHSAERHAIEDALKNLCVLEQDEVRYAAEEQRKAVQGALEKLRSIAPTIGRLQSGQPDGS